MSGLLQNLHPLEQMDALDMTMQAFREDDRPESTLVLSLQLQRVAGLMSSAAMLEISLRGDKSEMIDALHGVLLANIERNLLSE